MSFRDPGCKICVFEFPDLHTCHGHYKVALLSLLDCTVFYIAENVTCRVEIHQSGQLESGRDCGVESSCDNRQYQLALST